MGNCFGSKEDKKADAYREAETGPETEAASSAAPSSALCTTTGFKAFPGAFKSDGAHCVTSMGPGVLACSGEDGSIHAIDWNSGVVKRSWQKAHSRDVNRLLYHDGTQRLFSASRDKLVKCWSADAPDAVHTFQGHNFNVTCLTTNPDGTRLVSGSRDNSVRMWDTVTGEALSFGDIKLNIVHCVKWLPALNLVAQGGEDLAIRFWDVRTPNHISLDWVIEGFAYHPICVEASAKNDHTIYTGHNGFCGRGCMVTEWDLRQRKAVQHFHGHQNTVRCVVETRHLGGAHGPVLLSAADDGEIKEWSLQSGEEAVTTNVRAGRMTWLHEVPDEESTFLVSCLSGAVMVLQRDGAGNGQMKSHRIFGDTQGAL